jgi:hypothetical protein
VQFIRPQDNKLFYDCFQNNIPSDYGLLECADVFCGRYILTFPKDLLLLSTRQKNGLRDIKVFYEMVRENRHWGYECTSRESICPEYRGRRLIETLLWLSINQSSWLHKLTEHGFLNHLNKTLRCHSTGKDC